VEISIDGEPVWWGGEASDAPPAIGMQHSCSKFPCARPSGSRPTRKEVATSNGLYDYAEKGIDVAAPSGGLLLLPGLALYYRWARAARHRVHL